MSVNISGNLRKRLKEENLFITDLLELVKFPKNSESDSESGDDEGKCSLTVSVKSGLLITFFFLSLQKKLPGQRMVLRFQVEGPPQ